MTSFDGAQPHAIWRLVSQGIIQILKPYLGVKNYSKVEFEFKTMSIT